MNDRHSRPISYNNLHPVEKEPMNSIFPTILITTSLGLFVIATTASSVFSTPNSSTSFQLKAPMVEKVPSSIRKQPVLIKPSPSPSPQTPPPQPTSYRVKMWFTIQNANDGAFDNTIECYGELRIDGDLYWQIPRTAADNNQREAGQTLEISDSPYARRQFIFNKPNIEYAILLRDADGGSSDDDVYLGNKSTLNLAFLVGKGEQKIPWFNSKTREASTLHIRVEPN